MHIKISNVLSRSQRYFKRRQTIKHYKENISRLINNSDPNRVQEIYSDSSYINECRKFLSTYFPGYKDVRWHIFVAARNGSKKVEYIPEDLFYTSIITRLNSPRYQTSYGDKNVYDILYDNALRPNTLARIIDSHIYDNQFRLISDEEFKKLLLDHHKPIIQKNTHGTMGSKKVMLFKPEYIEGENFRRLKEKNWIFQEYIEQHPRLARLNNSSVNTIRIMTLRVNGEIRSLCSFLRIGGGSSIIDNINQGGLGCKIHEQGMLADRAYNSRFEIAQTHPQTGISFNNYNIPGYKSAENMCITIHRRIFHLDIIAWDIAIDKYTQPVLIEVNLKKPNIVFAQILNGPFFNKYTLQVLKTLNIPRDFKFLQVK